MNKKLVGITEGVLAIVLGVLIAVFGGGQTMDIIFGVIFVVAGAALVCLASLGAVSEKKLSFPLTFAAVASLFFGIMLLARQADLTFIIIMMILVLIAFGLALAVYGLYILVAKRLVVTGMVQILMGAVAATIGFLFIYVPEFQTAFWIIVGVLIGLYGLFLMLTAILKN